MLESHNYNCADTTSTTSLNQAPCLSLKSRRGFAGMSKEKQRAIASCGGKIAQSKGLAHRFTSEEAKVAGKKGGQSVSTDKVHMATIGKKGGQNKLGKKLAAMSV